ncbi:hypothetical protein SAMN05421796_102100 [Chryseobacterium piscicola]|uniref:Uncharacterized protein n=1 Tax=Chryseobacterium piscicola TaxID=551459 RepID=A0A1N7L876_9FLAO|nr:hypothetical protein B0A70_01835 [Chryseobacterium piscicola]SIS69993.1 hypothetical protein SAMN05421796_102100 [Chryseobacterium piscicola]
MKKLLNCNFKIENHEKFNHSHFPHFLLRRKNQKNQLLKLDFMVTFLKIDYKIQFFGLIILPIAYALYS